MGNTGNLHHYGVKGMKWGVRRYQNKDGSLTLAGQRKYGETSNRILKKGTEVQNISRSQLKLNNKKSNRIYISYTESDKTEYVDMMGNFQYDEKGYKNTFKVKKDINIASEREVVKTIAEMFREKPKEISKMMHKAYNATHVFPSFLKTEKVFERKMSELTKNPESKKSMKIGREFIKNIPMTNKTSSAANEFYSRMCKKGFDAVLDSNDAYGHDATQDPLIIFNMKKLDTVNSIKLTKKDLDAAWRYTNSREFKRLKRDTNAITHAIKNRGEKMIEYRNMDELVHYGVPGMKWGRKKARPATPSVINTKSKTAKKVTAGRKPLNPKKSVGKGKKRANSALSKIGQKTTKSVGKSAKLGLSVIQSMYNISDTAAENRKMAAYLNTASQMSPEYRRRFMYDY